MPQKEGHRFQLAGTEGCTVLTWGARTTDTRFVDFGAVVDRLIAV